MIMTNHALKTGTLALFPLFLPPSCTLHVQVVAVRLCCTYSYLHCVLMAVVSGFEVVAHDCMTALWFCHIQVQLS
jgi:hypothetical protein